MKNRLTQLTTVILLATALITIESCKKEDPPERTEIDGTTTTGGTTTGGGTTGGGTTVNGCTDADSPLYNSSATADDGSCQFAYTSGYEITYYPALDNGSTWDYLVNTDADLLLTIKEQGASSFIFNSDTDRRDNQDPSTPANWTAPTSVKLENKTYEWELYDHDSGSPNDLISSGTFNPINLANSGTITTTAGGSQLKITYNLQ
jgi:hypothetical protein